MIAGTAAPDLATTLLDPPTQTAFRFNEVPKYFFLHTRRQLYA